MSNLVKVLKKNLFTTRFMYDTIYWNHHEEYSINDFILSTLLWQMYAFTWKFIRFKVIDILILCK